MGSMKEDILQAIEKRKAGSNLTESKISDHISSILSSFRDSLLKALKVPGNCDEHQLAPIKKMKPFDMCSQVRIHRTLSSQNMFKRKSMDNSLSENQVPTDAAKSVSIKNASSRKIEDASKKTAMRSNSLIDTVEDHLLNEDLNQIMKVQALFRGRSSRKIIAVENNAARK